MKTLPHFRLMVKPKRIKVRDAIVHHRASYRSMNEAAAVFFTSNVWNLLSSSPKNANILRKLRGHAGSLFARRHAEFLGTAPTWPSAACGPPRTLRRPPGQRGPRRSAACCRYRPHVECQSNRQKEDSSIIITGCHKFTLLKCSCPLFLWGGI